MSIANLTIIGESINDSVPSTRRLFEAGDLDAIAELARSQDRGGASYIDVNVGARPAAFLADVVRRVQAVTTKPLSIDTPDISMAEAALRAYDLARADGLPPILNSISPLRLAMFELRKIMPCRVVLLVSERVENGAGQANQTAEQTHETARFMVDQAAAAGVPSNDCLLDPAICPISADAEGHLSRVVDSMRRIHDDPAFAGVHMSVGLSNFSVMLPSVRKDGLPVRASLENAFLTIATPLGLDFVIGSVKRDYQRLADDHPAIRCLADCMRLGGLESVMRVREFYAA